MSETVLRFLLSELQTVRIICGQCKGIIEVPLKRLAAQDGVGQGLCPLCRKVYMNANVTPIDPLCQFANCCLAVINMSPALIDLEFVIPRPNGHEKGKGTE